MRLHQKYILAVLPIMLIGIGSLGLWSYMHSRDALYRSEQETMSLLLNESINQTINSRYQLLEKTGLTSIPSFVKNYQEEAFVELSALSQRTGRRLFVIDREGVPLFCSLSKNPSVLNEWIDVALTVNGPVFGTFHNDRTDRNSLYAADVFERPGWNWVVFVSRPEKEVSERIAIIQAATLAVSVASMLLMIVMLVLVTRKLLLNPLSSLQKAAAKIAVQQPVPQIKISSNDELGELARDMETMSRSISSYIERSEVANRAKSNFLAHMSHELRSPLNSIMGYADLALNDKDHPDLPNQVRSYIQTISSSGKHLLDLIGDVLDLSKIEAGQLDLEEVPFNLPHLLEELISMMTLSAKERNNRLKMDIQGDMHPWVYGDPVRLRQVIMNFISNAIKFTKSGDISLTVTVKGDSSGGMRLRFAIRDTGLGIPRKQQELLFDAFTQADVSTTRKFGGTGLGLAINKKLISAMDGTFGLTSEVGEGSEFWFEAAFNKAEDQPEEGHVFLETVLPSLKLLLVEDIEVNQVMGKKLLENAGHQVFVAGNGKEAVEAAAELELDAVLMDIHMPVMDGLEATRQIRLIEDNRRNNVPIIALTADIERSNLDEYLRSGMNDVCSKPMNIGVLTRSLARVLDSENALKGRISPEPVTIRVQPREQVEKPLVNEEKFQEVFGLIPNCMDMFVPQSDSVMESLQDKLDRGVAGDCYGEFHTLKGMAANMGFDRLAGNCADGERNARRDPPDLDELRDIYETVRKTMAETMEAVSEEAV